MRFAHFSVVSREGLEPSTPGLKGPCSNQLSYRPKWREIQKLAFEFILNEGRKREALPTLGTRKREALPTQRRYYSTLLLKNK